MGMSISPGDECTWGLMHVSEGQEGAARLIQCGGASSGENELVVRAFSPAG
jgi:hypothetical protein